MPLTCRAVSAGFIEGTYVGILRHHAVSLAYLGPIDFGRERPNKASSEAHEPKHAQTLADGLNFAVVTQATFCSPEMRSPAQHGARTLLGAMIRSCATPVTVVIKAISIGARPNAWPCAIAKSLRGRSQPILPIALCASCHGPRAPPNVARPRRPPTQAPPSAIGPLGVVRTTMDKGGPPNSRRLPIAQRRRDRHPPFIEPVQACFALQHLASTTVSSNVPPIRVPRIRLCHRVGFFGAEPKHYRDFSRGWPGEGNA
jgi:hypothetical protein